MTFDDQRLVVLNVTNDVRYEGATTITLWRERVLSAIPKHISDEDAFETTEAVLHLLLTEATP